MTHLKTTAAVIGLALAGLATPAMAAEMPLFDAMASLEKKRGFDLERAQVCLLNAKVMEKSIEYGLTDSTSPKYKRSVVAAPKLEYILQDRSQTAPIFSQKVAAVQSEYTAFKSADKKERKRLSKIARKANKACTANLQTTRVASLAEDMERAKLIRGIDSNTAKLCYGIVDKEKPTDLLGLFSIIDKMGAWNRAYVLAKHREGVPETEYVEPLTRDGAAEFLKAADKQRVLSMYDTCGTTYEKADFEYQLTAPEKPEDGEEEVFERLIDWE